MRLARLPVPAALVASLLALGACQQETAKVEPVERQTERSIPVTADLVGLDTVQLEALLGPPELARVEPPAAVWQYRTESCVFDLFLFEESAAGLQVAETTARSRAGGTEVPDRCLAALVRRQADQVAQLPADRPRAR
jgi:hypothetical protein